MKSNDENPRATQSKSSKKSTKSRLKSSSSSQSASNTTCNNTNNTNVNNSYYVVNTPTTPTTSNSNHINNNFDASQASSGTGNNLYEGSAGSRSHHKSYAGFEPRSIKIIWEQHDQSDLDLSQDVCTRLAEDASYKLWELINTLKTYARHSGGVITYDLVNEVLRDADVPPVLGAMDSEWERIDYDGSFFFYSDKILELRDEYQKEINMDIPNGPDFQRAYLLDDKHIESIKKYVSSLIYVTIHGDGVAFETALQEIAFAPLLGNCFRVLLAKIIEIIAYKQSDSISERCWRLLKAATINPTVRALDCREEYFHLAEILVCQLIGPFESIKVHNLKNDIKTENEAKLEVKLESNDVIKIEHSADSTVKTELLFREQTSQLQQQPTQINGENIFRLQPEDDGTNDGDLDLSACSNTIIEDATKMTAAEFSPYFASPVDVLHLNELCSTLGSLADMSGYFERECTYLITRRLTRFFSGRKITTEREYSFIGRTLRGLIALGEYSFREFIPYVFKFEPDDVPENIWNDIALSAIYLQGPDDIFLYEWLQYVCGGDKLQPFMCYYAEYFEKLMKIRFLKRKQPTFKINPKPGVRRLEWSTIAAAMCHGDDPNKALKPKPTLNEIFPELKEPNLRLNRAGTIRFKFAGCRPVLLKRPTINEKTADDHSKLVDNLRNCVQHDILIAKRKLYKPLSNEKRSVALSSLHYLRI